MPPGGSGCNGVGDGLWRCDDGIDIVQVALIVPVKVEVKSGHQLTVAPRGIFCGRKLESETS